MTKSVDVAIIGSGCAGLFLALSLSRDEERTCAVIDEVPYGRYSSTKNQGWIHSGALYAAKGQESVALECVEAYGRVMTEYGYAIHDRRAFYGFHDDEFETVIRRLDRLPIRYELVDRSTAPDFLVATSKLPNLIEIGDRPFDTSKLLKMVLDKLQATRRAAIMTVTPASLTFQRIDDHWVISSGSEALRARALVLASGALIPDLGAKISASFAGELVVQKIEVLTIRASLTESLYATPRSEATPNVCPYEVGTHRGVTVCLTGDDKAAPGGAGDFTPREGARERFADSLTEYTQGVLQQLKGLAAHAAIYCCQKVQRKESLRTDDRSEIVIDFGPYGAPMCYALYPGKFTTSPIVARRVAHSLASALDSLPAIEHDTDPIEVDVSQQQYLKTDEFRVMSNGEKLLFYP